MLERWTAFLAQAAATVLVLIGLVVLLSYTHMSSYRAGQNSALAENAEAVVPPATVPVNSQPVLPQQSQTGLIQATATLPASQPGSASQRPDLRPDPPPNLGNSNSQDTGSLDVSDGPTGVAGRPSSSRSLDESISIFSGRGGFEYFATPGDDICHAFERDVDDAALARCWLRIGDAYQAINELDYAQYAWNRSIVIGSAQGGSQASLTAQQRMQSAALSRACPVTSISLERISRGFAREDVGGDIIDLQLRQQALAALGYYADEVDGTYGPNTRRAVRDFQADMGFDQTGALNPQETVDLVCHAAITARDPGAQNLLGIMFATGLGVQLNVDMAVEWLETASTRGHPEANFNLSLVYGTGTIQGSYRLCGVVESPERADSYLRRAAELGHGRARFIRDSEGLGGSPENRWHRIASRLASEAERARDPFYTAWQERLDEAEADAAYRAIQPGCYLEALEHRQAEAVSP